MWACVYIRAWRNLYAAYVDFVIYKLDKDHGIRSNGWVDNQQEWEKKRGMQGQQLGNIS